jgi:hypothetical protein
MESYMTLENINETPMWIWAPSVDCSPNQYVEFIREFGVDDTHSACMSISVDTNFAAWVNGVFVGGGQFSDYSESKTFSTVDITHTLKPGKNVLAVLVHYCGVNHFSYIPWQAGLWYKLQTAKDCIVSDSRTLCRQSMT